MLETPDNRENEMIHYEDKKTEQIAISQIIGGTLLGVVVEIITIPVWFSYFQGGLDWPVGELLLFSCGSLVPLLILLRGCRVCTAITAQPDGLTIKTCGFLNFFVPWENIIDLQRYNSWSMLDRMQGGGRKSMVRVKQGLTPIHRSPPRKESDGWHWRRGFEFSSAGKAYDELVHIIEEHVGSKQD